MAFLLLNQILVMFLYIAAGFALYRAGKITEAGSQAFASILVWLVIPVVMIRSFCVEPTPERLALFGASTVAALLASVIALVVSRLVFPDKPIDQFAACFSNAGFIGIPLVEAAVGENAVFCITSFIVITNVLQWTYGNALLSGKKLRITAKSLLNPIIIAALLGVVLFVMGWGVQLPGALQTCMNGVAAINAPLAMVVLGVYFARADIKSLLKSLQLYKVCLFRLVVIPALTAGALLFLPLDESALYAILIAAAAPVGANVAVYSQLNDLDYAYASGTVVLSTLCSVLTMPLLVYVVGLLA